MKATFTKAQTELLDEVEAQINSGSEFAIIEIDARGWKHTTPRTVSSLCNRRLIEIAMEEGEEFNTGEGVFVPTRGSVFVKLG